MVGQPTLSSSRRGRAASGAVVGASLARARGGRAAVGMIHGLEEELRVSRAILDGKFDKKPTTYEECEALVDALRNPEGAASEAPASEAPPAAQNCSECKKECGERLLTCAPAELPAAVRADASRLPDGFAAAIAAKRGVQV